MGKWKGILRNIKKGNDKIELFDLSTDIAEERDVASQHPEIVALIGRIFAEDRTPSDAFPFDPFDG